VAALVLWRGLDDLAHNHLFLINRSPSLPNWAYVVERASCPARAGRVLPAPATLVEAHRKTPSAFGKIALGLAGDVIEHRGDDVVLLRTATDASGRHVASSVVGHQAAHDAGRSPGTGPVGRIRTAATTWAAPTRTASTAAMRRSAVACRQIVGVATRVLL
jgi:conjugal transfer pilin signal peptidase TrbI